MYVQNSVRSTAIRSFTITAAAAAACENVVVVVVVVVVRQCNVFIHTHYTHIYTHWKGREAVVVVVVAACLLACL